MRKILAALTLVALSAVSANALPLFKVEAGAGMVKQSPSGWINYQGTDVDIKDDLQIADETKPFGWVRIEHPIPLIPNLKVEATKFDFSGSGTITKTFTFGGQTFTASSNIDSELRMDQYDLTIYWGVPFLGLATLGTTHVNFGLTVKYIDGYACVKTATQEASTDFQVPVPMGFLEGGFGIGPVSTNADIKWIGYGGSQFFDAKAEIRYSPIPLMFIGAGYRYEKLKIDDIEDISSDITIKGPYLEAGISF
ncbi:TIGR04219 family outer membrane beta-barrel protein [Desulfurobacterium atlanticum]|uniref:Outer membrane protein n=1 Tax=Desulfurobacterium atlanticum TaxID=240169 RepID=A0A238Z638_9BACT|nr:TIGR04219 family outer membrane beta-barrel protein [Desulfurobacterium atlanticum]SNR78244.1 outer membrane protein [Desulfurobacterium atlanticum]